MYRNVLTVERKELTDPNTVDLRGYTKDDGNHINCLDLQAKPVRSLAHFRQQITKLQTHPQKAQSRQLRKLYHSSFIAKLTAVLLIIGLNAFMLSSVGSTFSIFNDTETAADNNFESGLIDFELTLSPFSNNVWTNLVPGTTTDQDVGVMPHAESNPFFYYASSSDIHGDEAFCEALQVVATLDGNVMYEGFLRELLTASTTLIDSWNLEFSNDVNFFNSACHFDIDFNGWQTRHDYPQYHDGFSDTESTSHWLFSDGLKINKVYLPEPELGCTCDHPDHWMYGDDDEAHCADVIIENDNNASTTNNATSSSNTGGNSGGTVNTGDASSTTEVSNTINQNIIQFTEPGHPWVEIYNPNNEPADIDGWFLCDGQSCDELVVSEPIPPLGFAIVAGSAEAFAPWMVPDDFVQILVTDGELGDGLDIEHDALLLMRPDFVTFDQLNWGTPDTGWPYYNDMMWNPGIASTTEGVMVARLPTGFDTNQVSDWHLLLKPDVELLYPGPVVPHPWYWGYTYIATWEATNPNGPDEDLLIDLIMIQDTNYNHQVDPSDERLVIVEDSPNDGMEEVTVPPGFLGYIWILIVATGPENPMAHDKDRSGKIYDPIPTFMLDDEDEEEVILGAVVEQIVKTGESEYEYLLIDPATLEPIIDIATTSATSTNSSALEEIHEPDEPATTTVEFTTAIELVASTTVELATSTNLLVEGNSATSSEPVAESTLLEKVSATLAATTTHVVAPEIVRSNTEALPLDEPEIETSTTTEASDMPVEGPATHGEETADPVKEEDTEVKLEDSDVTNET